MAKKITNESVAAFMAGRKFNKGNMSVELSPAGYCWLLKLHGNTIARRDVVLAGVRATIEVSNGGWSSNTTKERLNGLPGVSVVQRNFIWYLNGKQWDGSWCEV